jgi:chromosome segregation ATPase
MKRQATQELQQSLQIAQWQLKEAHQTIASLRHRVIQLDFECDSLAVTIRALSAELKGKP